MNIKHRSLYLLSILICCQLDHASAVNSGKNLRGDNTDGLESSRLLEQSKAIFRNLFRPIVGCGDSPSPPSPTTSIDSPTPSTGESLGDTKSVSPTSSDPSPTPSPTDPKTTNPTPSDQCLPLSKKDDIFLQKMQVSDHSKTESDGRIGCFKDQDSLDMESFSSTDDLPDACSTYCGTDFFGLFGTICKCFSEYPEQRLSISGCSLFDGCDGQKMEVYFKNSLNDNCDQDITKNVRNQLVQENNAEFGFDIVRNKFVTSPFEFYSDGCGTNIYDLKTDVSGNSGSMTTIVNSLEEYAKGVSTHLSESISLSAELEYKGLFKSASGKVSASSDFELNRSFNSQGASESRSKIFTSFGVHRLAEIELVNFDDKKYFATFNNEFINALKRYQNDDYDKSVAQEIFNKFGTVVLERGLFGGYVQFRSTAKYSDISGMFDSDSDMSSCYEAAVAVSGKFGPISGSFSADTSGCSQNKIEQMQAWQDQYSQDVEVQTYVGGSDSGGEFIVTPEEAKLLKSTDMYPAGEPGLRLRLMTDFLKPEKISPLEIKRHLILESEFRQIQTNLQEHLLEILQDIGGYMDGCLPCEGVPYLEQKEGSNDFVCNCYDPGSAPLGPLLFRHSNVDWSTDANKWADAEQIGVQAGGWNQGFAELTSRPLKHGEKFSITGTREQIGAGLCIDTCNLASGYGIRRKHNCIGFYGDGSHMFASDENNEEYEIDVDRSPSKTQGFTYDAINNCVTHVGSRSNTCTKLPDHFAGKPVRAIATVWNNSKAKLTGSNVTFRSYVAAGANAPNYDPDSYNKHNCI